MKGLVEYTSPAGVVSYIGTVVRSSDRNCLVDFGMGETDDIPHCEVRMLSPEHVSHELLQKSEMKLRMLKRKFVDLLGTSERQCAKLAVQKCEVVCTKERRLYRSDAFKDASWKLEWITSNIPACGHLTVLCQTALCITSRKNLNIGLVEIYRRVCILTGKVPTWFDKQTVTEDMLVEEIDQTFPLLKDSKRAKHAKRAKRPSAAKCVRCFSNGPLKHHSLGYGVYVCCKPVGRQRSAPSMCCICEGFNHCRVQCKQCSRYFCDACFDFLNDTPSFVEYTCKECKCCVNIEIRKWTNYVNARKYEPCRLAIELGGTCDLSTENKVVIGICSGVAPSVRILEKLGLHIDVYVHIDIDPISTAIAKSCCDILGVRFEHFDDVHKLSFTTIMGIVAQFGVLWGIVATPPCGSYSGQNITRRNEDRESAMFTPDGSTLFQCVSLIRAALDYSSNAWFILEETASLPACTKRVVTNLLRSAPPIVINSKSYSAARIPRRRCYWTNIPQDEVHWAQVESNWASIFGPNEGPVVTDGNLPQRRCITSSCNENAKRIVRACGGLYSKWKHHWIADTNLVVRRASVTRNEVTGKIRAFTSQELEIVMGATWGDVVNIGAFTSVKGSNIVITPSKHNQLIGLGLHWPTLERFLRPLQQHSTPRSSPSISIGDSTFV